MPVAEVEDEIRKACRRWRVVEIIADPFRWTRTLQALEAEAASRRVPALPARLTAATGDLYSAALNARMTHSGDRTLAEHVAAAIVVEDARGIRLSRPAARGRPKDRPGRVPGHGLQSRHLARNPSQEVEDKGFK